MNLLKYLQEQGIDSRKGCQWLIRHDCVRINGELANDEKMPIVPEQVHSLHIDDEEAVVIPLPHYYILLNKPADYETSHKPRDYPSVFSLFPDQLRVGNLQAIGRLDADTTGVLLLTNDGQFNHRMTSPKHKVAKVYRVTLKHAADETLCAALKNGVLLHDENETVVAENAILHDPHTLILTLCEGKYHQVKRMVAAAGNRVAALHRERFGDWDTQDLAAGEWRFIQP
ncbi:16S rRNA pseudouridine(516) synthase [Alysiella filiformis]|uniref:Pseudouridine synthase n=1 Tax=Alysiella filiformis DSM 16848 TaxID=1120981 RepID=A0A286E1V7_9NEIS|nr:pseudouridine synthase [Alysiella filiformis]QMT30807.1 pseudouridine synthase [Alysiella filiformis]UBQ56211.1 pseudouridine synthase [Alysiella filiformis DSM 16848]SOD64886.1 ribosomal small subunit pseudouridine synthase A [Alysiella filiformis DSM 16848]